MARDVEILAQGTATAAARLCNFVTGDSRLIPSHRDWLNKNAIPAIRNSPNPWVDVFGYASHLGDAGFNKQLADRRCSEVVQFIKAAVPNVSFPQQFGFGESRSGGGATDNDGYWRSVDVYVYAAGKPPGPPVPPKPPEPQVLEDWFVTEFSGRSESVVITLGYSAMTGNITFQRADGPKYRGAIGLFGLSAGLSLDPTKVPGLGALLKRFPALNQLLGGGAPAANDLLKWISRSGILQQVINKTPGGLRLYKLLVEVILGGSVAPDWDWIPSRAIGIVLPFKPPLNSMSFYGSCMCYSLTATAAIANGGTYILFFGYRGNMYSPGFSMNNFNGCALISQVGTQIQVPGLGAAGTLFVGEIA